MAQTVTLEGLRNQIITSVFGNRLGLDKDDLVVGFPENRVPITNVTSASTASTVIPAYGITIGRCTDASGTTAGWGIDNPIPGVVKTLVMTSSGYGVFRVDQTTATTGTQIFTTDGTTNCVAIFIPGKQSAQIVGITTNRWFALGQGPSTIASTDYVSYTISTAPWTT